VRDEVCASGRRFWHGVAIGDSACKQLWRCDGSKEETSGSCQAGHWGARSNWKSSLRVYAHKSNVLSRRLDKV
jgi:hypothetical protein